MKKRFFIQLLLVVSAGIGVTVFVTSCNKLDLTPLDKTTTSTFFNKKGDVVVNDLSGEIAVPQAG